VSIDGRASEDHPTQLIEVGDWDSEYVCQGLSVAIATSGYHYIDELIDIMVVCRKNTTNQNTTK
jgi:hypothetical protein